MKPNQLMNGFVGGTVSQRTAPITARTTGRYRDVAGSVARYELNERHGPAKRAIYAYLVSTSYCADDPRIIGTNHEVT
jgi:hypothetical protein